MAFNSKVLFKALRPATVIAVDPDLLALRPRRQVHARSSRIAAGLHHGMERCRRSRTGLGFHFETVAKAKNEIERRTVNGKIAVDVAEY
ncbi:hypothetical protein M5E06_13490 [Azospirillum sp. A1-3]|uniref:hypothetical protein n=1 Tax=Azospirillum sp. A1-3 TaxID=185874 RepID=UPI00207713F8|nr:hypothetical protein [Azospirillum sp. A1-3]MCM8735197.1 hypothetical protein [Azospirillum sp. A1-3]